MIIYVNQFNLIGNDSLDISFRSISGWLKKLTSRHFTIDELKSGEEFKVNKSIIRTFNATYNEPFMYSILFSHPDNNVRGRQWVTEIGIKYETEDNILFSISLETSDISTQVKKIPSTTRPSVVKYLRNNATFCKMTVGLKYAYLNNSEEEFSKLKEFIFSSNRNYPIVLVHDNNDDLIKFDSLQEQLIGLAQVIVVNHDINTFQLETVLGQRYSVWDGAINIIFPLLNREICHNKLISKQKLIELSISGTTIHHELLSLITHNTNGFNKKSILVQQM